jgi:valyl-tRNA synthetase
LEDQAKIEKRERENQELENKYNTTIQAADKLFQAEDYKAAQAEYVRAKNFIKRPWPEEQIIKINKILEEKAAAEKAEKLRIEKEARVLTQYNSTIQKADIEFDKSNYIKASSFILTHPYLNLVNSIR